MACPRTKQGHRREECQGMKNGGKATLSALAPDWFRHNRAHTWRQLSPCCVCTLLRKIQTYLYACPEGIPADTNLIG